MQAMYLKSIFDVDIDLLIEFNHEGMVETLKTFERIFLILRSNGKLSEEKKCNILNT